MTQFYGISQYRFSSLVHKSICPHERYLLGSESKQENREVISSSTKANYETLYQNKINQFSGEGAGVTKSETNVKYGSLMENIVSPKNKLHFQSIKSFCQLIQRTFHLCSMMIIIIITKPFPKLRKQFDTQHHYAIKLHLINSAMANYIRDRVLREIFRSDFLAEQPDPKINLKLER